MRKILLSMMLVLVSIASYSLDTRQAVFYEGFEDGVLPEGWVSESIIGEMPWSVELGTVGYPTGAASGSYRVAIRNNTQETLGFKTRLITPAIDLSSVMDPILVFSHAQLARSGDFETLEVYYRTDPAAAWIGPIVTYDKRVPAWTSDTVELINPTATYQISFVVADKMGRGVVIDDVMFRPAPKCDSPQNVMVAELTSNSAMLNWSPSNDANQTHLIVSTSPLANPDNATGALVDTRLDILSDGAYALTGLERNTTHYVYLQSECTAEESAWTSFSFTTKNLVSVPYSLDFNTGNNSKPQFWTLGSDQYGDDGNALIYSTVYNSTYNYYYSPDSTGTLAFAASMGYTPTPISAGVLAYAITPELDVTDAELENLSISLWASNGNISGAASQLLVGLMADEEDLSTLTVIDTISLTYPREMRRFELPLKGMSGKGRYVAFISNFANPNFITIDDLQIKQTAVAMPSDLHLTEVHSQKFTIDANLNGAPSARLIVAVSSKAPQDPTTIAGSSILLDTVVSSLPQTIQLPETNTSATVLVYAQAIAGEETSNWSMPIRVLLPLSRLKTDLPFTIGFESSETPTWSESGFLPFVSTTSGSDLPRTVYTQPMNSIYADYMWPSVGYSVGYNKTRALRLTKMVARDSNGDDLLTMPYGDYIVLPELDSLTDVVLSFYLQSYGTSYPQTSHVEVGVMTNPADPSTFIRVSDVEGAGTYRRFFVAFDSYQGEGRFIAIRALDAAGEYIANSSYNYVATSFNYLDNITLDVQDGCNVPYDDKATVTESSISLTWNANKMEQWQVAIYGNQSKTAEVRIDTVQTNAYTFNGLSAHTTYYYQISGICEDGSLISGDMATFTTPCAELEALPYTENFDGFTSSEIGNSGMMPFCWDYSKGNYSYTYSYYDDYHFPYIYTASYGNYARSGSNLLCMGDPETIKEDAEVYFVLPQFEKPINQLEINFWARLNNSSSYYDCADTLAIGAVMGDDITTFEEIDRVVVTTDTYTEFEISLVGYKGNNNRIAIRRVGTAGTEGSYYNYYYYAYIDDINVHEAPKCERIRTINVIGSDAHNVTLGWQSLAATSFEVILSTTYHASGADYTDDEILYRSVVTSNPFTTPDTLAAQTTYYAAVRAYCGDGEGEQGQWSATSSFRTQCEDYSLSALSMITFTSSDVLNCWTTGLTTQSSSYASSYIPQRSSATGFGYVLHIYDYYYSATSAYTGGYAILPGVTEDISTLQITFAGAAARSTNNYSKMSVGVVTDPSDIGSFTKVGEVTLEYATDSLSMQYYTVPFNTYYGDYMGRKGKYIAFLSENTEMYNELYIDNITIETIPAILAPDSITISQVADTMALLSWSSQYTQFEVGITRNSNLDAAVALADESASIVSVENVKQLEFTGLEPLKTYFVYVRAINEGDTSRWSNRKFFTTICPPTTALPYFNGFEDVATNAIPDCWDRFFGSYQGSAAQSYVSVSTSYHATGSKSLRFYGDYYSSSSNEHGMAVLPIFDIDNVSNLLIEFDARLNYSNYNASLAIGVADEADSKAAIDSTVQWVDTIAFSTDVFAHYSTVLSSYEGTGKYIVLQHIGSYYGFYIDNLQLTRLADCMVPQNLHKIEADADSLTIAWTDHSFSKTVAEHWDVNIALHGAALDENNWVTIDSLPQYTFHGLQMQTEYDVYVRRNCGDEVSDVLSATFTSACAAVNSWSQNLENLALASESTNGSSLGLECWDVLYDGSSYGVSITDNSAWAINGKSLKMNLDARATGCIVLPQVDNVSYMQLNFNYKFESYSTAKTFYFRVGVASDVSSVAKIRQTFVQVGETIYNGSSDNSVHAFETDFSSYDGDGKYIVIMAYNTLSGSYYQYYQTFDDFRLTRLEGCLAPVDVKAIEVTNTSITLGWAQHPAIENKVGNWDLAIVEAGNAIDEEGLVHPTPADTTVYTFTGLNQRAAYDIYLRANCGTDSVSEWVKTPLATSCDFLTGDLFEDFESVATTTEGSALGLDCWATYRSAANTHGATIETNSTMVNGTKGVKMNNSSNSYTYLVLPPVDDVRKYQMSYYQAQESSYNTVDVVIGVATATSSLEAIDGSFVEVAKISDSSTSPSKHEVDFSALENVSHNIVIKSVSSSYYYVFIDDIQLTRLEGCLAPSLKLEDLSSDFAKVTFAPHPATTSVVTEYEIALLKEGGALSNAIVRDTISASADLSYEFTGLTPATAYTAQVRQYCEDGTTDWVTIDFTTSCVAIKELDEDFDSHATSSTGDIGALTCWSTYTTGSTSSYTTYGASIYSSYGSSDRKLSMYAPSSGYVYVALPIVDNVSNKILEFDFNNSSSNTSYAADVFVGVATSADGADIVSTLTEISRVTSTTNSVLHFSADFAEYTGTGKYIVIGVYASGYYSSTVYIDNVKLTNLEGCIAPANVIISEVTSDAITLTWAEHAALADHPQGWDIAIVEADSTLESFTTLSAETLTYTFSELETKTSYDVYVRTHCATDSVSEWVKLTTTTSCEFLTSDFFEDFESAATTSEGNSLGLDCWATYRTTDNTHGVSISTSTGKIGNQGLKMNNTYNSYSYVALPPVDDVRKYQLSYYQALESSSYPLTVTIGVASDASSLSALENSFVEVATINDNSTSPSKHEADFLTYEGTGHYIVFRSYFPSTSSYYYVMIDDIQLTRLEGCIAPVIGEATDIESDAFIANWAAHPMMIGDFTYELALVRSGEELTDSLVFAPAPADTTAYRFTGLDALTSYDLYVRTVCGEDSVSPWSVATVTTACGHITDAYKMNFDGANDTEALTPGSSTLKPMCWTVGADPDYSYSYATVQTNTTGYSASIYSRSGNNALRLYHSGSSYGTSYRSYAIMPQMDLNADSTLLRFWGRGSYYYGYYGGMYSYYQGRKVVVGTVEDDDFSTFVAVDTLSYPHYFTSSYTDPSTDENEYWVEYTLSLKKYAGKQICFASYDTTTYTYFFIDDIEFLSLGSCLSPVEVRASNVSSSEADITAVLREDEEIGDGFLVELSLTADFSSVVFSDTITTTTSHLTGLVPATTYYVRLQHLCDVENEMVSGFVSASFLTECAPMPASVNWDFESSLTTGSYPQPQCWVLGEVGGSTSTTYIPYTPATTSTYDYGRGRSGHALQFYQYSSSYSTTSYIPYAILPELAFDIKDYVLNFWGRAARFYSMDYSYYDDYYYDDYISGGDAYEGNANYSKKLVLGTVDGTDISTFTPMDTITYKTNVTYSYYGSDNMTQFPNDAWEEFEINLAKYVGDGKRIAIVAYDTTSSGYFYIDDLEFYSASACAAPATALSTVSDATATITWSAQTGDQVAVVTVATDAMFVNVVFTDTITTASVDVTDLQSKTKYYYSVIQLCDTASANESRIAKGDFTTTCGPVRDVNTVLDFESDIETIYKTSGYYSTDIRMPECWTGAVASVGTGSNPSYYEPEEYLPNVLTNSSYYQYSRSGKNALRLRPYTSDSYNSYLPIAVMPMLDVDTDEYMLHLWGRAAYFYPKDSYSSSDQLYTTNSSYARQLIIGTIDNPADASTFTPIDTLRYDYVWSSTTGVYASDDPDDYWQEYVINLSKYAGKQVAFTLPNANGDFYIDDISLVSSDYCSNVQVTASASSKSITFSWDIASANTAVFIEVATDKDFENLVFSDTIRGALNYTLMGLEGGSEYFYRYAHVCHEGEMTAMKSGSTRLSQSIRFFDNFSEGNVKGWTFASGKYTGSVLSAETSADYTWQIGETEYGINGVHAFANSRYSQYHWIITPTLDLSTLAPNDSVMLTFEMMLTADNDITPKVDAQDNKVVVAFSTNGGQSWTNPVVWSQDGTGDYDYFEIAGTQKKYYVNLNQFVGQNIQIAFGNQVGYEGASNCTLHIDNVSVNFFTGIYTVADICEGEDYADEHTIVYAEELELGENNFDEVLDRLTDDGKDLLDILSITVHPVARTVILDTVCLGVHYNKYDFDFDVTTETVYRQRKLSAMDEFHCDSVVELYLLVNEPQETSEQVRICYGDYFEYNGERYTSNAIIVDTLVSAAGCDSIHTIYLQLSEAIHTEVEATLCPGSTITLGDLVIDKAGEYTETLRTANGRCDSIVTLTVTVSENSIVRTSAVLCAGETYSDGEYFQGLNTTGIYVKTVDTEDGCQEQHILTLVAADAEGEAFIKVEPTELPFILNGEQLLSEFAAVGKYDFDLETENCTVHLVVQVGEPTSLLNLKSAHITVSPNPVRANDDIRLNFNGKVAQGTVISVMNVQGAVVYRQSLSENTDHITLSGVPAAGAYILRLEDNDETCQTKLIAF